VLGQNERVLKKTAGELLLYRFAGDLANFQGKARQSALESLFLVAFRRRAISRQRILFDAIVISIINHVGVQGLRETGPGV
jgi:hypothetical protein